MYISYVFSLHYRPLVVVCMNTVFIIEHDILIKTLKICSIQPYLLKYPMKWW